MGIGGQEMPQHRQKAGFEIIEPERIHRNGIGGGQMAGHRVPPVCKAAARGMSGSMLYPFHLIRSGGRLDRVFLIFLVRILQGPASVTGERLLKAPQKNNFLDATNFFFRNGCKKNGEQPVSFRVRM
jgi:hypothetical protein